MSYFAGVIQKPWLAAAGAMETLRTRVVVGNSPDVEDEPGRVVWPLDAPFEGFLNTAQILSVSSTSANDAVAGTGARKARVEGLDASWNIVTEEVDLAGLAPVPFPTPMVRVNLFSVFEAGSGQVNEGDLLLQAAGGENVSYIAAGDSWGRVSAYTVPAGYRGVIVGAGFTAVGKQANGRLRAYTNPGNVWFNLIEGTVEDSTAQIDISAVPGGFNEKVGISIWAQDVTSGPATMFAVFEIMVIEVTGSWPQPAEVR